jgi:hypothetical protein
MGVPGRAVRGGRAEAKAGGPFPYGPTNGFCGARVIGLPRKDGACGTRPACGQPPPPHKAAETHRPGSSSLGVAIGPAYRQIILIGLPRVCIQRKMPVE